MEPHPTKFFRSLLLLPLAYLAPAALAQTSTAAHAVDRITAPIDDRVTISRTGNVHPLAQLQYDRGIAPPETRMDRMLLLLQPDPSQQRALDALLEAQQDPGSPQYHQWLTPEAFGRSFGVAERDLSTVVEWLEGHGFQVEPPAPARREIIFSGTAAQVLSAFHTELHVYEIHGQRHYANASDPQIPLALADVVGGVVSLNDFLSQPLHRPASLAPAGPEFTSGGAHYLGPADFATIYDVAALYSQSVDGTGQSVAVLGRTDLKLSDVQSFRSDFGLPANNPNVVLNGPDPGVISVNEQAEATLDVEWAGAVAKKATVQFVLSASTNSTDGIALSAEYAVNHQVAPVVSLSFGSCEAANGAAGNQFWNALWQQAAAQGMTVLVAAGDSGAAGCDSPSETQASQGAGVNALCSSPFSTCVGGTEFSDASNPNAYWSASSNSTTLGSALSYIPEAAWNQSGTVSGGSDLWAGGGGASEVYSKPSWQTGPGVPSDGRRDVPDVSLNSASHDGYLIVLNGQLNVIAGTSCATPAAAGLLALVVQKSALAQGNVNPRLYTLAAQQASGGASVFHDTQAGNNSVPGQAGFNAGPGYDEATGLGSVDAALLVNHWSDPVVSVPALGLSAAPQSVSVTQGGSASITVTTSVSGGFKAAVALSAGSLPAGLSASFSASGIASPGSGGVTLELAAAATMTPGTFSLSIGATGGGLSAKAPVAVTVLPNCQYSLSAASVGESAGAGTYSAAVTVQSGCAWAANTSTSWITLASGSSGSGSGKFGYTLAANTGSQRAGSITVAGLSLVVTQAAATAVFSLKSTSANVPASGGTAAVSVSATPSNATWAATSNVSWISITQGASGTGAGTVTYSVASNTSAARTGVLTIAGLYFTVNQTGATAAQACTYKIALGPITGSANGYSGTVAVTAASGCQWTGASNEPWLSISSGGSGSGNGVLSFLATLNASASPRTATLTVAGFAIGFTEGPAASGASLVPFLKP